MSQYKPYPAYKETGVECITRVPEHWQILPLRRIIQSIEQGWSPKCSPLPAGDGEWGVLKAGCVNNGEYRETENKALPSSLDARPEYEVHGGDILMSRASGTPELVGSAALIARTRPKLMLSDKVFRIVLRSLANPRFFVAAVGSRPLRFQIENELSGGNGLANNLPQSAMMEFVMARPPLEEQTAITAAIARETVRIDELIAKKTVFIELLKEKRRALITRTITKGLNPDVKMKDSGVEWIGQLPHHWKTVQLGKLAISRCDGPFGSGLKSEHYTESGVRVVRLQNIGEAAFKDGDAAYIDAKYWQEGLGGGHEVRAGDILIAGLGDENNPLGRACVAPDFLGIAMVKADCYRFRLVEDALPEFVALALSATARAECGYLATGATRDRLNLTLASARILPIPSVSEQTEIVRNISRRASRIDLLVEKTHQSIALLRERRSALITAAVTGQIDLRAAV